MIPNRYALSLCELSNFLEVFVRDFDGGVEQADVRIPVFVNPSLCFCFAIAEGTGLSACCCQGLERGVFFAFFLTSNVYLLGEALCGSDLSEVNDDWIGLCKILPTKKVQEPFLRVVNFCQVNVRCQRDMRLKASRACIKKPGHIFDNHFE